MFVSSVFGISGLFKRADRFFHLENMGIYTVVLIVHCHTGLVQRRNAGRAGMSIRILGNKVGHYASGIRRGDFICDSDRHISVLGCSLVFDNATC